LESFLPFGELAAQGVIAILFVSGFWWALTKYIPQERAARQDRDQRLEKRLEERDQRYTKSLEDITTRFSDALEAERSLHKSLQKESAEANERMHKEVIHQIKHLQEQLARSTTYFIVSKKQDVKEFDEMYKMFYERDVSTSSGD